MSVTNVDSCTSFWVFNKNHTEFPKQDFSLFNFLASVALTLVTGPIYSGIFKYFCFKVSKAALCTLPTLHFLLFTKPINSIWTENCAGFGAPHSLLRVCADFVQGLLRWRQWHSIAFFFSAMNFAFADKSWYGLCKRMQTTMSWKHLINRLLQADTLF
jgi:hypothetical protein